MRKWVAMAVLAALPACASAGRYGYARTYAALDAEEGWVARSEEPVYDELRRMPEHFAGRTLALFGVVTAVAAGRRASRCRCARTRSGTSARRSPSRRAASP